MAFALGYKLIPTQHIATKFKKNNANALLNGTVE
jgi:hypothetical protein